eukprot:jgi/Undpi1/4034/HiC_scaffold_16.g07401.m1
MEGAATAMQVAALREEMEEMRRELAAVQLAALRRKMIAKLRATPSEAQHADSERATAEQRRKAAGTSVRQEQEARAGTLATAANHTRSAPTPEFDEEATRGEKGEDMGDEDREEQAEELSGVQTSRSGSSAQDGQRALPQLLPIERSPF